MTGIDDVANAVELPACLVSEVRTRLCIGPDRALRIAYVAGPGDAYTTFQRWHAGFHDDRLPVLAYSAQFYSFCSAAKAEALVIVEQDLKGNTQVGDFVFETVDRNRGARRLAWHYAEHEYGRRLLSTVRRWKPDVIVVGGDMKPILYRRLARVAPVILTIHNTFWPMGKYPETFRRRQKLVFLGRALSQASGAVCTSLECARQLRRIAGQIGPVEVEIPQIMAARETERRPRDKARNLLFLGRIEADKGVFDLLQAFLDVAQHYQDAMLVLAGKGSADEALRAAIADHPAGDRIEFAGLLDGAGVHKALAAADLLICPTRSEFPEGLALVVVEAAMQGVPSIASSVVPAAELAQDCCVTFPADDVGALTSELCRLMEDEQGYQRLVAGTGHLRSKLFDRKLGWGSKLGKVLASL